MLVRKMTTFRLRRLTFNEIAVHTIHACKLSKQLSSTHFTRSSLLRNTSPLMGAINPVTSSPSSIASAGEKNSANAKENINLANRDESDETVDEEFDELEAALQEVHDLGYAIVNYLRRADPAGSDRLFEPLQRRRFREPVPAPKRRLLHTHGDRSYHRCHQFQSKLEFEEATRRYINFCTKILTLLQNPLLIEHILRTRKNAFQDWRKDGVHRYRRLLEGTSWNRFPYRWFKHSPFEVQQLRADIPASMVQKTRFYRDSATLGMLFTLIDVPHPFRAEMEEVVFVSMAKYDEAMQRSLSGRLDKSEGCYPGEKESERRGGI